MKLFYVQADDADGDNLDWFVVANDVDEVKVLWAGAIGDSVCESGVISRIRVLLDDVTGTVFEGPAQRVDWADLVTVYKA